MREKLLQTFISEAIHLPEQLFCWTDSAETEKLSHFKSQLSQLPCSPRTLRLPVTQNRKKQMPFFEIPTAT
jgi:hypothetical protein